MSQATQPEIPALIEMLPTIGITLSVLAAVVAFPGSTRTKGARAFAWWLVLGGAFNLIGRYTSRHGIVNQDFFQWYRLFSVSLMGLTAYHLLPSPRMRRLIVTGVALYAIFWLGIVGWVESSNEYSRFTSPAEQAIGLLIGILFVREALTNSETPPWRNPAAWLGIGLAIACSTGIARAPISHALGVENRNLAITLYALTSLFGDIALILYCIAYRSPRIVWTR